jgi:hypothetical protein
LIDLDVDERIILKWIFITEDVRSRDWIDLAQDRKMSWALVNVATNLGVPYNAVDIFTIRGIISF